MKQNKDFSKKNHFSTAELAELLGVSRIAIFKKIRSGAIKAEKVGRNYIIPRSELEAALGQFLSEEKKKSIDRAVDRTVREYGETLRRLGRE